MSTGKTLKIDCSKEDSTSKFAPRSLILSSHQAGWKNIHLGQYQLPAGEIPEITIIQHTIILPTWTQPTEVELVFDGKYYLTKHVPNEIGCITILPTHVPIRSRWNQENEVTQCYLNPTFLAHAAYESINPDKVEIGLAIRKPDPLVWQIVSALKSVLETDPNNSKFYAESMATALAAHFLQYYSICKPILYQYEDGLPKHKLKQAIEYINEHLDRDLSLEEIATKLDMSQFYFCRLFKKSTGLTPHRYLIRQRVEKSKQLLKQTELNINEIAIECGFANPSHFAKWFRQFTGISPRQFRQM